MKGAPLNLVALRDHIRIRKGSNIVKLLKNNSRWVNSIKKSYSQILMVIVGVLVTSAIIYPTQSEATGSAPIPTHTEISFTLLEGYHGETILSGTSFGARNSTGNIIYYGLRFKNEIFGIRNKHTTRTTDIQYAEITYDGGSLDYEAVPEFADGGRGYEDTIVACDRVISQCALVSLRLYVTNVPEIDAMSGNVTVSSSTFVGDTVTADFSRIRDQEGVNNLSIAWSRAVCPSDADSDIQGRSWPVRGIGRWSVSQRIGSADDSHSYQLTNTDIRNRVKSVWGQYQADSNHYKWVCKDIRYDDDVIQTPPEPENTIPRVGYGPGHYYVNENSRSGTLSADGETPEMYDVDQETIRYSIIIPEDTPDDIARTIRSTFRVRNTAPNPTYDNSPQPISISSNRSFNYETTPEFDDGSGRGYVFDVKGCDPRGGCETSEGFHVYVVDVVESNAISGSVSITGQHTAGQVLTADFSGITDTEGIDASIFISWRYGPCSSSKGTGNLPRTYGSNKSYVNLNNVSSPSYTIQPGAVGRALSVWGSYRTNNNFKKWVCRQANSIRGDSSLPTVSVRRSGRSSLPAKEHAEFTLTRTNQNLSSSVTVYLEETETWVENGNTRVSTSRFDSRIPANETQRTLSVKADNVGTLKVKILPSSSSTNYHYNVGSPSTATVTVTAGNVSPTGKPVITGTPQVGQTLTADASSIMDGNGISRSFSYTWWKEAQFGSNASRTLQKISGATRSTYTIREADARFKIKVKVSYRDDNGFNHELESDLTAEVQPIVNNAPSIVSLALQDSSQESVDLGSLFKVSPGDLIAVIAYMSEEISGLSATTGEVSMRLNIGDQTRLLHRSPFRDENNPERLIFHYTVEAGVSGNVTFPRNGMFIGHGYDEHNVVVPNPSAVGINVNLNYPQTHLGDMDIFLSANVQNMPESHSGSSFTFRLNFSEPLGQVSQQAVRSAFTITNGTISGLQKVDDSNWDVTVNPDSSIDELIISFVHQKRCDQSLALCTSNGHVVDSVLSATVVGGTTMSIGDVSANERTGSMTFNVVLSKPYTEEITVDWATTDLTATAGSDYTSRSGTLTFAAGDTSKTIKVVINNDNLLGEADETFQVTLSNQRPANRVRFEQATATGTIINANQILVSVENAADTAEEDGPMTFNVVLDKSYTEEIKVDWATSDDRQSALGRYISSSGTLTFTAGDTSETFTVALVDDNIFGGTNFFNVQLSNPRPSGKVWFAKRTARGSITDASDDPNQQRIDPVIPEEPTPSPITASFIGMPSEHDGTNPFTFELRFSEDVAGLSYRTLKGSAFQVTNGSIKNARRLARPANQRWEITVQPSNNDTVSVMLPPTPDCSASGAICHRDGRKLSNGIASMVQGLVGISVADASANENTASSIDFTVSLSRSSANTITVRYATQDGSATAGQDYTSKSGTLTFAANETSKTVSVSILGDNIDEGNETFTLRLSNPTGNAFLADSEATGTIENSDPMPSAWLSRFGRTVGSQAVDAISSRMGKTAEENQVVIGGMEMSMEEETEGVNQWDDLHEQFKSLNDPADRGLNNRTMTLEELAHGTSFNLSGENESTGRTWSAWGQFTSDYFEGKEDDLSLEGKVTSGFLGADVTHGNWQGGVAVSSSKGEGTFHSLENDSERHKGEVESKLTSVYPYIGYEFGENKAIWGMLGIGGGDVTITQKNRSTQADVSMYMGAVGAKGPLLNESDGDVMDMTLQTDGMWVQMDSEKTTGMASSETDVTRLRLTLDTSKNFDVGKGTLTPSVQLGVRHDGGDAEEGMGVEAGGGVRYVYRGLTLEAEASKLLVHEDSKYEEWGASAAIRLEPGKQGRGLSLSVVPTWGTSNNVDRLWSAEGVHKLGRSDDYEASKQLNAEIGYGLWRPLSFLEGLVTPYLSLSLGEKSNSTYRAGARWNIAPNATMSFGVDHTKNQTNEEDVIMLQGRFRW